MQIRPFCGTFPDLRKLPLPVDEFFETVKEAYPEYVMQDIYHRRPRAAFYIYRIEGPDRHYTGFIACTAIEDYLSGRIKQHEKTIAAKELQQVELILKRNAAVKPVLLTYPQDKTVDNWLNAYTRGHEPFFVVDFSVEKCIHRFWEVGALDDIEYLKTLFGKKVPITYIADGHHRLATVASLYHENRTQANNPFQNALCAYFPAGELDILDFNRVVDGLNEYTPAAFLEQLSAKFRIQPMEIPGKPVQKFEITMYLQLKWYKLQWKPVILDRYAKKAAILDAKLLDNEVLKSILGIAHPDQDDRLHYVEGPKGIKGIVVETDRLTNGVGFCLYPIALPDMMLLADRNKTLPAKSTWFEPRMKNGLVVLDFS